MENFYTQHWSTWLPFWWRLKRLSRCSFGGRIFWCSFSGAAVTANNTAMCVRAEQAISGIFKHMYSRRKAKNDCCTVAPPGRFMGCLVCSSNCIACSRVRSFSFGRSFRLGFSGQISDWRWSVQSSRKN